MLAPSTLTRLHPSCMGCAEEGAGPLPTGFINKGENMAVFHLGLTMAGAISAGAYSAGVFDFLVEALDAWEDRRRALEDAGVPLDRWDIPCHRVEIPVIAGASAGGITGALGLVALAEAQDGPGHHARHYEDVGTVRFGLPRLYSAWVEAIRFVGHGDGPALLGTDDLGAGPVRALLDTTILDAIAGNSLAGVSRLRPPRPWLAEDLHLFLTHANTRGVPYEVRFSGGDQTAPGYGMLSHGDRRHYVVRGVGTARFESPWARPDPATTLDLNEVPALADAGAVWAHPLWGGDYCNAVLGTSAFPLGLAGRPITAPTVRDYCERQWPLARFLPDADRPGVKPFRLQPAFPAAMADDPGAKAGYLTLDGGMINNEPFEIARWTLLKAPPKPNPREAEACDRAVVMVDPFPAPPEYLMDKVLEPGLRSVVGRILPTLMNHARFKPDDMADALDETVMSRFLIAPRRRSGPEPDAPLERHPIACGLLGGFGGFLAESFRAHDYQLGRLNAYWFLKKSLALPLDNPILGEGYRHVRDREGLAVGSGVDGDDRDFYPLIPLVGTAAQMPEPPRWPRVGEEVVDAMVTQAMIRAEALVARIRSGELRGRLHRWTAGLGWSWAGRGMVREAIRHAVLRDLILRDQLEGPTAGRSKDERRVIAALLEGAFDFRTVKGLAEALDLDAALVARVLEDPHFAPQVHCTKRRRQPDLFTWKDRAPRGVGSWFGIRHARQWFTGTPVIDSES